MWWWSWRRRYVRLLWWLYRRPITGRPPLNDVLTLRLLLLGLTLVVLVETLLLLVSPCVPLMIGSRG